jgi:hypothetical protein
VNELNEDMRIERKVLDEHWNGICRERAPRTYERNPFRSEFDKNGESKLPQHIRLCDLRQDKAIERPINSPPMSCGTFTVLSTGTCDALYVANALAGGGTR